MLWYISNRKASSIMLHICESTFHSLPIEWSEGHQVFYFHWFFYLFQKWLNVHYWWCYQRLKPFQVTFKILCMKHIKQTVHTLKIKTVIIYSPSCCSKPAWFSSVEKKKTFNSKPHDILFNISQCSYYTLLREREYKGTRLGAKAMLTLLLH